MHRARKGARAGQDRALFAPHLFGQAKVRHLGHQVVPLDVDQDVPGLQISVDDSVLVKIGQASRHCKRQSITKFRAIGIKSHLRESAPRNDLQKSTIF